jgi:hypothetical protein
VGEGLSEWIGNSSIGSQASRPRPCPTVAPSGVPIALGSPLGADSACSRHGSCVNDTADVDADSGVPHGRRADAPIFVITADVPRSLRCWIELSRCPPPASCWNRIHPTAPQGMTGREAAQLQGASRTTVLYRREPVAVAGILVGRRETAHRAPRSNQRLRLSHGVMKRSHTREPMSNDR